MEVHVRCIGMARLDELLKRSEERLADMRGFWRSTGLYLVKRSVNDSFGKEQSPNNAKWAPWSKEYKKRMRGSVRVGTKSFLTKVSYDAA